MNQWFSVEIGDGIQAYGPSHQIQEAWLPLFVAAGQPTNMAVFSRYDTDKNIVTVYFSPGASALASIFKAIPCEKPKKENRLGLLVGDARSWQLFFPGE